MPGKSMVVLRQAAIYGGVLAGVLLLMPCSPLSVWGKAWCPTSASAVSLAATTSLDFNRDVVTASKSIPVLVDFNATWCGPCQMLGPELEQLAKTRSGKLVLVPIDVDQHGDIALNNKVEGIPDVRLWKDGREIAHFVGYRSPQEVTAWLDAALTGTPP